MLVYFDDNKEFFNDLYKLIEPLDKYAHPLVVVPTEKDVKGAIERCKDGIYKHVVFISYDYWLSKKWIADADYDHIDFFRVDQFLMSRAFGIKVGAATIKRTMARKEKEER